MTEPEASATDTTTRGRPRPDSTIERDEKVLAAIVEAPGTRKALVERTGLAGNEVYLSLYRLSRANPPKIKKVGSTWQSVDYVAPESPAPEAPTAPTE